MYRYVHSRLSNVDLSTNRENQAGVTTTNGTGPSTTTALNMNNDDLHDSLSNDDEPSDKAGGVTAAFKQSTTSSSSKPISASHQVPPPPPPPPPIQHRIGSNRLLSDLAVASLPPASNIIRRDPLIYSNHGNQSRLGEMMRIPFFSSLLLFTLHFHRFLSIHIFFFYS